MRLIIKIKNLTKKLLILKKIFILKNSLIKLIFVSNLEKVVKNKEIQNGQLINKEDLKENIVFDFK
ncbi:hypothetical protein A0H76_682 [Hepatospora eriocheir]|uniref:Uncharacterized protein n=1 Tax=Hepatospora eriocheir TaxID=1081669 RepID=A0A1X0QIE8_9MICR|nr:hypothetical protein A0H76_682 [Hepatospora eriocheir]